jgi:hypothetical protein
MAPFLTVLQLLLEEMLTYWVVVVPPICVINMMNQTKYPSQRIRPVCILKYKFLKQFTNETCYYYPFFFTIKHFKVNRSNEKKNKKYITVGTTPKSNRKLVEIDAKSIP